MRGNRKRSEIVVFEVDTLEKALVVIEAMWQHAVKDKLKILFQAYPELKKMTQQELAFLLGVARESVTRSLKYVR
jgi:predicted HTH transcriptional regulator